jgi:hypothetical protein
MTNKESAFEAKLAHGSWLAGMPALWGSASQGRFGQRVRRPINLRLLRWHFALSGGE